MADWDELKNRAAALSSANNDLLVESENTRVEYEVRQEHSPPIPEIDALLKDLRDLEKTSSRRIVRKIHPSVKRRRQQDIGWIPKEIEDARGDLALQEKMLRQVQRVLAEVRVSSAMVARAEKAIGSSGGDPILKAGRKLSDIWRRALKKISF